MIGGRSEHGALFDLVSGSKIETMSMPGTACIQGSTTDQSSVKVKARYTVLRDVAALNRLDNDFLCSCAGLQS